MPLRTHDGLAATTMSAINVATTTTDDTACVAGRVAAARVPEGSWTVCVVDIQHVTSRDRRVTSSPLVRWLNVQHFDSAPETCFQSARDTTMMAHTQWTIVA
jgi:hypothetical protein